MNQPDAVEIARFAEQPLLAILSTVNRDGSPQATPVWYLYEDGLFKVGSRGDRVKVRNIRRDPRVSLVVIDTAANGEPLAVRGTAEVTETGAVDFTHQIACRYEGGRRGDREAEKLIGIARDLGQPRVIIEITPHRVKIGD